MVSVMLLLIALMTVGMLVVQSANRELSESGAMVARERATMSAHAAAQLAGALYRQQVAVDPSSVEAILATALTGTGATSDCSTATGDCVPAAGAGANPTGFRAQALSGFSDCSGMPCMRPGAVVNLPTGGGTGPTARWVDRPLSNLLAGGDPEAVVTVWIRNNVVEVFKPSSPNAVDAATSWLNDADRRVVLTASATVRNSTIVVEQELALAPLSGVQAWSLQTPDEGYGGGHNNDNASVSVCSDDYAAATSP
jgi:hypothetical protein